MYNAMYASTKMIMKETKSLFVMDVIQEFIKAVMEERSFISFLMKMHIGFVRDVK
jgi:hypothetical protein